MNLSNAWKHVAAIIFSVIVFSLSTVFLILGRAAIATSLPLLLTIVAGYVVALATAFPAQMSQARAQAALWYTTWKNPTNPGSPSAPGGA